MPQNNCLWAAIFTMAQQDQTYSTYTHSDGKLRDTPKYVDFFKNIQDGVSFTKFDRDMYEMSESVKNNKLCDAQQRYLINRVDLNITQNSELISYGVQTEFIYEIADRLGIDVIEFTNKWSQLKDSMYRWTNSNKTSKRALVILNGHITLLSKIRLDYSRSHIFQIFYDIFCIKSKQDLTNPIKKKKNKKQDQMTDEEKALQQLKYQKNVKNAQRRIRIVQIEKHIQELLIRSQLEDYEAVEALPEYTNSTFNEQVYGITIQHMLYNDKEFQRYSREIITSRNGLYAITQQYRDKFEYLYLIGTYIQDETQYIRADIYDPTKHELAEKLNSKRSRTLVTEEKRDISNDVQLKNRRQRNTSQQQQNQGFNRSSGLFNGISQYNSDIQKSDEYYRDEEGSILLEDIKEENPETFDDIYIERPTFEAQSSDEQYENFRPPKINQNQQRGQQQLYEEEEKVQTEVEQPKTAKQIAEFEYQQALRAYNDAMHIKNKIKEESSESDYTWIQRTIASKLHLIGDQTYTEEQAERDKYKCVPRKNLQQGLTQPLVKNEINYPKLDSDEPRNTISMGYDEIEQHNQHSLDDQTPEDKAQSFEDLQDKTFYSELEASKSTVKDRSRSMIGKNSLSGLRSLFSMLMIICNLYTVSAQIQILNNEAYYSSTQITMQTSVFSVPDHIFESQKIYFADIYHIYDELTDRMIQRSVQFPENMDDRTKIIYTLYYINKNTFTRNIIRFVNSIGQQFDPLVRSIWNDADEYINWMFYTPHVIYNQQFSTEQELYEQYVQISRIYFLFYKVHNFLQVDTQFQDYQSANFQFDFPDFEETKVFSQDYSYIMQLRIIYLRIKIFIKDTLQYLKQQSTQATYSIHHYFLRFLMFIVSGSQSVIDNTIYYTCKVASLIWYLFFTIFDPVALYNMIDIIFINPAPFERSRLVSFMFCTSLILFTIFLIILCTKSHKIKHHNPAVEWLYTFFSIFTCLMLIQIFMEIARITKYSLVSNIPNIYAFEKNRYGLQEYDFIYDAEHSANNWQQVQARQICSHDNYTCRPDQPIIYHDAKTIITHKIREFPAFNPFNYRHVYQDYDDLYQRCMRKSMYEDDMNNDIECSMELSDHDYIQMNMILQHSLRSAQYQYIKDTHWYPFLNRLRRDKFAESAKTYALYTGALPDEVTQRDDIYKVLLDNQEFYHHAKACSGQYHAGVWGCQATPSETQFMIAIGAVQVNDIYGLDYLLLYRLFIRDFIFFLPRFFDNPQDVEDPLNKLMKLDKFKEATDFYFLKYVYAQETLFVRAERYAFRKVASLFDRILYVLQVIFSYDILKSVNASPITDFLLHILNSTLKTLIRIVYNQEKLIITSIIITIIIKLLYFFWYVQYQPNIPKMRSCRLDDFQILDVYSKNQNRVSTVRTGTQPNIRVIARLKSVSIKAYGQGVLALSLRNVKNTIPNFSDDQLEDGGDHSSAHQEVRFIADHFASMAHQEAINTLMTGIRNDLVYVGSKFEKDSSIVNQSYNFTLKNCLQMNPLSGKTAEQYDNSVYEYRQYEESLIQFYSALDLNQGTGYQHPRCMGIRYRTRDELWGWAQQLMHERDELFLDPNQAMANNAAIAPFLPTKRDTNRLEALHTETHEHRHFTAGQAATKLFQFMAACIRKAIQLDLNLDLSRMQLCIAKARQVRNIHYVRPQLNHKDRYYNATGIISWGPNSLNHMIYQDKLETVLARNLIQQNSIFVLIDVHYYLNNVQFADDALIIYSGLHFPLFPGSYTLPWDNGTLQIWNDKVAMKTHCQDEVYVHDNVRIKNGFDCSYNPGYLNCGYGRSVGRDFKLETISVITNTSLVRLNPIQYHLQQFRKSISTNVIHTHTLNLIPEDKNITDDYARYLSRSLVRPQVLILLMHLYGFYSTHFFYRYTVLFTAVHLYLWHRFENWALEPGFHVSTQVMYLYVAFIVINAIIDRTIYGGLNNDFNRFLQRLYNKIDQSLCVVLKWISSSDIFQLQPTFQVMCSVVTLKYSHSSLDNYFLTLGMAKITWGITDRYTHYLYNHGLQKKKMDSYKDSILKMIRGQSNVTWRKYVIKLLTNKDKVPQPNTNIKGGFSSPNYYQYKKPQLDYLYEPTPMIIKDDESRQQLKILADFYKNTETTQGQPVCYDKRQKKYVPCKDLYKKRMIQTCYPHDQMQSMKEFEFSQNSLGNTVSALCRQLGSRTIPQRQALEHMTDMIDRFYEFFFRIPRVQQILQGQTVPSFKDPNTEYNLYAFNFNDYAEKFDGQKSNQYQMDIQLELNNLKRVEKMFVGNLLVKSGEVYESDKIIGSVDPYYQGDERPRMICNPSKKMKGVVNSLSAVMQQFLMETKPNFICGYNLQELQNKLGKSEHGWVKVSYDGSAFDSTQYEDIQTIVQGTLWKHMKPYFIRIFQDNFQVDITEQYDRIYYQIMNIKQMIFVKIPMINAPKWTPEVHKLFNRHFGKQDQPWQNYIYVYLNGTTGSGFSFRTTVGNTENSGAYQYFYLEQAGLKNPWLYQLSYQKLSTECKYPLFDNYNYGDDSGLQSEEKLAHKLKASILQNSLRDKNDVNPTGLGQVIKTVQIGSWNDFEYASKKFYYNNGQLYITNDIRKTLFQKIFYTKQNQAIFDNPALHTLFKRYCIQGTSPLLEALYDNMVLSQNLNIEYTNENARQDIE